MSATAPNLFIIGAQKAGSTNLAAHMVESPDVEYFGKKEPNIFSQESTDKCLARLQTFPIPDRHPKFLLDGSPDYSRYPSINNVPKHIFDICGATEPRFIYIIRNPVERVVSHYFWSRQQFGESYPFEVALEKDSRYIEGSLYDMQIEQYLKYFRIENFHFVKFEDFAGDPVAATQSALKWAGASIPADFDPEPEFDSQTDKKFSRQARFPFINRLVRSASPLRKIALSLISPHNQLRIARLLSKPVPRPPIPAALKRQLLDTHFRGSIRRTAELTGLDLSDWEAAYSETSPQTAANA